MVLSIENIIKNARSVKFRQPKPVKYQDMDGIMESLTRVSTRRLRAAIHFINVRIECQPYRTLRSSGSFNRGVFSVGITYLDGDSNTSLGV